MRRREGPEPIPTPEALLLDGDPMYFRPTGYEMRRLTSTTGSCWRRRTGGSEKCSFSSVACGTRCSQAPDEHLGQGTSAQRATATFSSFHCGSALHWAKRAELRMGWKPAGFQKGQYATMLKHEPVRLTPFPPPGAPPQPSAGEGPPCNCLTLNLKSTIHF